MREPNDWRLRNQFAYLRGLSLIWQRYRALNEGWDHDHCEFCWSKFAEHDNPEVLREGYTTPDTMHWVCSACFEDFKDLFEWQVAP
jgi:hypothetical protein